MPLGMPHEMFNWVTPFYAIGDILYNEMQDIQQCKQMVHIPAGAEFVIHNGDLRNADHHDSYYLVECLKLITAFPCTRLCTVGRQ